jgi:hypothetical protein
MKIIFALFTLFSLILCAEETCATVEIVIDRCSNYQEGGVGCVANTDSSSGASVCMKPPVITTPCNEVILDGDDCDDHSEGGVDCEENSDTSTGASACVLPKVTEIPCDEVILDGDDCDDHSEGGVDCEENSDTSTGASACVLPEVKEALLSQSTPTTCAAVVFVVDRCALHSEGGVNCDVNTDTSAAASDCVLPETTNDNDDGGFSVIAPALVVIITFVLNLLL